MEAIEPVAHGRAVAERDRGRDILEPNEFGRCVADDAIDIVRREETLGADERGHRSRACPGRLAPQPLDGVEARRGTRLDQHDQPQAPGRQAADLVGLVGDAQEHADFGGTGSPAASIRATQSGRSQRQSRKGYWQS